MEATWNAELEFDLEADARRRVRRALGFSALGHVLLVVVLMLKPGPDPIVFPAAITVDLVASVPAPAPRSRPAPAPVPAPVAKPRPAPPPPPQAKILPKRAPEALAKPVAKPKPVEPIRRRSRPKEMELGDAMAALRGDLGESVPDAPPTEVADAAPAAGVPGTTAATGSATISPELRAWMVATTRHIQSVWVNPKDFVGRGLLTELRVELGADGTVLGTPEVLGTSGDPYADDNAVRALLKSSPLPPPPAAGAQVFIFSPEASSR